MLTVYCIRVPNGTVVLKVKNFNNGDHLCAYSGTDVLSYLLSTILITFYCYGWGTVNTALC